MRKLFLTTAAALAVAVFAAWNYNSGGGRKAEAVNVPPIHCSYVLNTTATPPSEEVTCNGDIFIVTPFGTKEIKFTLVVDAVDNPPPGPSFGDKITACTISFNGGSTRTIHVGPCP